MDNNEINKDDVSYLKKQIAGLRGENTKLRKALDEKSKDVKLLHTCLDDAHNKLNFTNQELIHYKALHARPWYKRIFG